MEWKKVLVIAFGIIWFVLSALFIIGFEPIEKLLACMFMFAICFRYIYAFFLNRPMYVPYSGEELPPTGERNIARFFLFFVGVVGCTCFTFYTLFV
ncbi:hypothetical protein [Pseudoalteromonas piscicida]|uniref:Uncharacterized protein n=1 Tax=Pseudoalteromonas piscicida TaxID=43662 RepID=A0A2A5JMU7_PSEO7|nr:hypothetical protein [Pseudoalteromonas piscicida]PCK30772.1 hypothetical protein CEX98_16000 [Pseudoalteromonas piscicida]